MKICVFGDSITYAGYIKDSWPNLLRSYLEKESNEDVEFYNLGININTSDDIVDRFEVECTPRKPSIVIFAYSINDSSYILEVEKSLVEIERFKKNTQNLIDLAKSFTNKIIFVGLVLGDDSQLKPYHLSLRGKKVFDILRSKDYDNALKKIAEENGGEYIYLFDKLTPSDFIDGLHPNEIGHMKMFEVIKDHFPTTK